MMSEHMALAFEATVVIVCGLATTYALGCVIWIAIVNWRERRSRFIPYSESQAHRITPQIPFDWK